MCFSMNNAKFLRTPILKNFCERLFLYKTIHLIFTEKLYSNFTLDTERDILINQFQI